MVHLMLSAFRAARFANLSTDTAQLVRELRSAAHEGRCAPTGFSAVTIEADAFRHLGYVAFLKTRALAVLARLGTLDAGCDATLKFLMSHFFSFANNDTT